MATSLSNIAQIILGPSNIDRLEQWKIEGNIDDDEMLHLDSFINENSMSYISGTTVLLSIHPFGIEVEFSKIGTDDAISTRTMIFTSVGGIE